MDDGFRTLFSESREGIALGDGFVEGESDAILISNNHRAKDVKAHQSTKLKSAVSSVA